MPAAPQPIVDAAMFARVFENHHEGRLLLEELTRRFARPPVLEGGIDGIRKSDFRAGQREVVEFIVRQINRANGVTDANPEESEA
jgi:hypothetical protein